MNGVTHAITYRHPVTGESMDAYHNQYVFMPDESKHYAFIETAEGLSGFNVILKPVEGGGIYVPVQKCWVDELDEHILIYEKAGGDNGQSN